MVENKYKPGHPEFLKEAGRLGLTGNEHVQKLREKGILPDPIDINRKETERYIRNRKYKNTDIPISKIESNNKIHFYNYCDIPVDKIYSIPRM